MRKFLNFLLKFATISVASFALLNGLVNIGINLDFIIKEDEPQATMVAEIVGIGEKIEVEVIEGEHGASGTYWVIVGEDTVFEDSDGSRISLASLQVGDHIKITYSGQVMMSYPPQIVAKKITIVY